MINTLNKIDITKFKISFIIFVCLGLFISLFDLIYLELIEQKAITDTILQKLSLLIIILSLITGFLIDFLFNPMTKKVYNGIDKSTKSKLKVILKPLFYSICFSLFYFIFFQGSISLLNRSIGAQNDIQLSGIVKDFKTVINKGRENYHVKIFDTILSREVEFKTQHKYQIGELFTDKVKIGSLGYIYKK